MAAWRIVFGTGAAAAVRGLAARRIDVLVAREVAAGRRYREYLRWRLHRAPAPPDARR